MFVDIVQTRRIQQGQSPAMRPVFLKLHGVASGHFEIRADLPEELAAALACPAFRPSIETGANMKVLRQSVASEIGNIKWLLREDYDAGYDELLTGKSVAIVGPAETMIGSGQGSLIDSHDIVVRFNTVIEYLPFSGELARDIGTKTDIIYCNNEVLVDGIAGQKEISQTGFSQIVEKLAIRYFISTNNDFTYETSPPARRCYEDGETFRRFLDTHNIKTGFRMLFAASDRARKWLNGHVGRTGFIAILDLLASGADRICIAGMTFYHKGGHLFLADRADELHPLKNHRGEVPKDNSPGHNSYLELELMRLIAARFKDRLEWDEPLQKLLESSMDE